MANFIKVIFGLGSLMLGIVQLMDDSRVPQNNSYDWRKEVKRQQNKERKIRNSIQSAFINQTWYGMVDISGEEYFEEIFFKDAMTGTRFIYLTNKGHDGCFIKQEISWKIKSVSQKLIDESDIEILAKNHLFSYAKCNETEEKLIKYFETTIKTRNLKVKDVFYGREVKVLGYSISSLERLPSNKLKEIILLKKSEQKLATSLSWTHNNFLKTPELRISDINHDLKLVVHKGTDIKLGTILFKKRNYVFTTDFWESEKPYHSKAILKNVNYLDKNGVKKTGDLQICSRLTGEQRYWIREVGK